MKGYGEVQFWSRKVFEGAVYHVMDSQMQLIQSIYSTKFMIAVLVQFQDKKCRCNDLTKNRSNLHFWSSSGNFTVDQNCSLTCDLRFCREIEWIKSAIVNATHEVRQTPAEYWTPSPCASWWVSWR